MTGVECPPPVSSDKWVSPWRLGKTLGTVQLAMAILIETLSVMETWRLNSAPIQQSTIWFYTQVIINDDYRLGLTYNNNCLTQWAKEQPLAFPAWIVWFLIASTVLFPHELLIYANLVTPVDKDPLATRVFASEHACVLPGSGPRSNLREGMRSVLSKAVGDGDTRARKNDVDDLGTKFKFLYDIIYFRAWKFSHHLKL
ncbi:hypothetical protein HJC23_000282 [Cyclotella cryptica]|uniref:Uncharacterized protein n=1 Tax=Cyclotella cryptica TaxID=29204 RepID=A0ABD3QCD9_9STRA